LERKRQQIQDHKRQLEGARRSSESDDVESKSQSIKVAKSKGSMKVRDAAQDTPRPAKLRDNLKTADLDNNDDHRQHNESDKQSGFPAFPPPSATLPKVKRERPVENITPTRPSTRTQTIRDSGNALFTTLNSTTPIRQRPKFKEERAYQYPWQKPFIYPAIGKNKTTVEFEDLTRFDDDEMLNDNLVSFNLRYLEEHNPQSCDRVYVFNTFFYSSLMKNKPNVDYDSVKRWTAKVDLFKYDHVVVPINEKYCSAIFHVLLSLTRLYSLHWYLAIICNINRLLPNASSAVPASNSQDPLDDLSQMTISSESDRQPKKVDSST
jgi:Ulp1 family protease